MPRLDYKRCKVCGRSEAEVGPLSHTRLCSDDANARRRENNMSLHHKSGPAFAHWRRQMAASVGGVLLDDLPSVTHTAR